MAAFLGSVGLCAVKQSLDEVRNELVGSSLRKALAGAPGPVEFVEQGHGSCVEPEPRARLPPQSGLTYEGIELVTDLTIREEQER
jgi:hypothetical protein